MAAGKRVDGRKMNNTINQLEQMQKSSLENLQELFRHLPNPELFREGLVNLLNTATELLKAYDNAMGTQNKHPSNTYSERRVFTNSTYFPSKDLVVRPEKDVTINSVYPQNYISNYQGQQGIVKDQLDPYKKSEQSNSSVSTQSKLSLGAQNNETYPEDRPRNSLHYLNSRSNMPNIVSQRQITTSAPYERCSVNFQGTSQSGKQFVNQRTQTPISRHQERLVLHESLENKLKNLSGEEQTSGALLQDTQKIENIYHVVRDNTEDSEECKREVKISTNRTCAGGTPDRSNSMHEIKNKKRNEGTSEENTEVDNEMNADQMKQKIYCDCKVHSKRYNKEILSTPPNTPLGGDTNNYIRDRNGRLMNLSHVLTPDILRKKLRVSAKGSQ